MQAGRLESGRSGNPGGEPKVAAGIRDLAREHSPRAIARLVALMDSENESAAVRAAEALLDRGYSRPMQAVELSRQEGIRTPKLIEVTFVTPAKTDDPYSVRSALRHRSL
jgi:HEAT repeat protein